MKKLIPFMGAFAAVFALVAFILMMTTPGVTYPNNYATLEIPGTTVLFGGAGILGLGTLKLAPIALVAWILVIVAFLALAVVFICEVLGVKAIKKFGAAINVCASILLIAAGVLAFFAKANFLSANGVSSEGYALGVGYIISGILLILGGCIAFIPMCAKLLGKK